MVLLERALAAVMVVPFGLGLASGTSVDRDVAFRFADPQVVESSGLVTRDGLFATVNDSGDVGRTFVVDGRTGETVGGTTWGEARDVEALAPYDGGLLVGDIGDNRAARDSVEVLRVPFERGSGTLGASDLATRSFELVYPGGPRDAESLLVHPVTQQVFVVSKDLFAGTLYAAPSDLRADEPNALQPLGPVLSIATDGAFFPDGEHFVLRDYGRAVVYAFPSLVEVGDVELPEQPQGEGIAVAPDGTVYVSSEGQRSVVLRVALPDELRQLVTPGAPTTSEPTESASPVSDGQTLRSREGRELPETTSTERPAWPWFVTGLLAVGGVAVLLYSLRRR